MSRNVQNNIEGFYVYRAIPNGENGSNSKTMSEILNPTDENIAPPYNQSSEIIGIFLSRVIQSKTLFNKEKITIYTYLEFLDNTYNENDRLDERDQKLLKEFTNTTSNIVYEDFKNKYPDKIFKMYEDGCNNLTCKYSQSFINFVNTLFGIEILEKEVEVFEFSDNDSKQMIDDEIKQNSDFQIVKQLNKTEEISVNERILEDGTVKYFTDKSNLEDIGKIKKTIFNYYVYDDNKTLAEGDFFRIKPVESTP